MSNPKKTKLDPEYDKRTNAYRARRAAEGFFDIEPVVETYAAYIYEAGYRPTTDHTYWVPTREIAGVVASMFPDAPPLDAIRLGQAIRAAEPDAKHVYRRPVRGGSPVRGYSGIKGPCGCRTPVVGD